MMRVLRFFAVIIPCAGFSALQWIWRYTFHRSTMNPEDRARVEHAFGINDPRLDPIWKAAVDFHTRKDVMSEWVKLDAQRGGKFLSLVAMLTAVPGWIAVSVLTVLLLTGCGTSFDYSPTPIIRFGTWWF